MSISLPLWVGQNFLTDAQATEDGLLGVVNPIFKTIGEDFGTPVILNRHGFNRHLRVI